MKYQFIALHQQDYPISTLCRVLQITVSGYYAWHKRAPSQRSQEDAKLSERIERIYQTNRQVYGSPRIHAALHARSAKFAGRSGWRGSCESVDLVPNVVVIAPALLIVSIPIQWLLMCWTVTLARRHPIPNGWPISQGCGRWRAGSISRSSWISSHA